MSTCPSCPSYTRASIQNSGRQCSPRCLRICKVCKKINPPIKFQTENISSLPLRMHRARAGAFRIPPLPYTCLILPLVPLLFIPGTPRKAVGNEDLPDGIYTDKPICPSHPQPQTPRSKSHTPALPHHLVQRNPFHSHGRQTFPASVFFAEKMRMAYQMILLSVGVR